MSTSHGLVLIVLFNIVMLAPIELPLLGYIVGLVVLMGLACALFGAALNYLFLERTASQ